MRVCGVAVAVGVVLVSLARPVAAAPITYQESVNGDLTASPVKAFTLELGSNTVAGNAGSFGSVFDDDPFDIVIPVGMTLTSMDFAFSASFGTIPNPSLTLSLFDLTPSSSLLTSQSVAYGAAGHVSFAGGLLPLSADTYRLLVQPMHETPGGGTSTNYTWTLNVAQATTSVPEPASMTLLGVGLAGMGVRRWRQNRARQ